MKVFSFVFVLLVFSSFSMNVQAESKKQQQKCKVVTVTFDEADIRKANERGPASLVEKQEIEAQARSEVRVNRDDWSALGF